jgi:hypothetical protein
MNDKIIIIIIIIIIKLLVLKLWTSYCYSALYHVLYHFSVVSNKTCIWLCTCTKPTTLEPAHIFYLNSSILNFLQPVSTHPSQIEENTRLNSQISYVHQFQVHKILISLMLHLQTPEDELRWVKPTCIQYLLHHSKSSSHVNCPHAPLKYTNSKYHYVIFTEPRNEWDNHANGTGNGMSWITIWSGSQL